MSSHEIWHDLSVETGNDTVYEEMMDYLIAQQELVGKCIVGMSERAGDLRGVLVTVPHKIRLYKNPFGFFTGESNDEACMLYVDSFGICELVFNDGRISRNARKQMRYWNASWVIDNQTWRPGSKATDFINWTRSAPNGKLTVEFVEGGRVFSDGNKQYNVRVGESGEMYLRRLDTRGGLKTLRKVWSKTERQLQAQRDINAQVDEVFWGLEKKKRQ